MYQIVNIRDYLKTRLSNAFVYIPNPGNAGDSLIGCATIQLFDELKLPYTICTTLQRFKGRTLVYGGGGNLVPMYPYCKQFITINQADNEIVILPQSVFGNDDVLRGLGKHVTIIARDLNTYNYLNTHMQFKENLFISHDMALYLNLSKLGIQPVRGEGVLHAYRTDDESTGKHHIPEDNIDVSNKFSKGTGSVEIMNTVSQSFLSFINKYEVVYTDRLHVAIGAAMLGKYVHMYDNTYSKCKSIYEYSIKGRCPRCVFHESASVSPTSR